MAKRKNAEKAKIQAKPKIRVSFGTLAFAGIFVVAYAAFWMQSYASETLLLVGLLGMAVAIFNIRKSEEKDFTVAITAFLVAVLVLSFVLGYVSLLSAFLTYLAVGFGVAGMITAFYMIIRLGYNE
ncbi:MAG: hypothetical protein WA139_05810 [Candidatus Aenigmatarchaeota archaeon]